jgi:hypothetical protein
MVRRSYRYELRSAITYPLAASLAEGSFTGVVAAKYFNGSALLIAVITAAPMFGNIMAMVWAEMAKGRRKVPFVNLLQAGVVSSVAAVALTAFLPRYWGGWVFAALIILARVMAAGIITIRSDIWRLNYPPHLRGQIVARITVVATVVLAAATLCGSWRLDGNPRAFVYLYPTAAALGAIGIWQFSHIRVRKERQVLRSEQLLYTPRPESMAQTDEANVLNYPINQKRPGLLAFFAEAKAVLKRDKAWRDYQRWQFLSGFSFMMINPPLVFMVSRQLTEPIKQYLLATVVLQIIPMITSIVFTQVWAPLFDRVHITKFRVFQGSVSVTALATLFLGAALGHLWLVAVAQFLIGTSLAGGNLAWSLGHTDFAPKGQAATYMGIHVMLTGLRGCIAPFVGAQLFAMAFMQRGVFLVAACINLISLIGFYAMSRHAPRKHATVAEPEPVAA